MDELYHRLAEVYDWGEEPRVVARVALKALREPTGEVLQAGIPAELWRSAIDAMLKAVDAADAAEHLVEAEVRRSEWLAMRSKLEALGCRLWRCGDDEDRWRIEGSGFDTELDLATGRITDSDGDDRDPSWTFEGLVETIRSEIRDRRRKEADKARRRDMRKEHNWVNGRGWVPKSGIGPIIPGGGHV